jgi:hypothetical protein
MIIRDNELYIIYIFTYLDKVEGKGRFIFSTMDNDRVEFFIELFC